ncbi:type II toxin-antitoxin system VapC family toxin [bacterium]|nr:type II toxin-antitoxin system VapC family toxin [bacterium]
MIVVDTNIIAYLFIEGERTASVNAVLRKDAEWIAPLLWRSEFRSVLTLYLRQHHLTLPQASLLMDEAEDMMQGREYQVPSATILELVNRTGLSAYDGEFAALAGETGVPLVTTDKDILAAVPGTALSIEQFLDTA